MPSRCTHTGTDTGTDSQDEQNTLRLEDLAECEPAKAVNPSHAQTWFDKAMALMHLKQYAQALHCFDNALALQPDLDFVHGERLNALLKLCKLPEIADSRPQIHRLVLQGKRACMPFEVLALFDDPALQQQAARIWTDSIDKSTKKYPPLLARKIADQNTVGPSSASQAFGVEKSRAHPKLRVAYFSADFCNHPVTTLIQDVIACHDRKRFEVIGMALSHANDPMRQRIQSAFDEFHELQDLSDDEIVEFSRGLGIDIAIDLSGFTLGNRFSAFQSRLAPLQVSYLGYLGTSASEAIDYLIADPVLIPAQQRDFYSEKIVYLPWYQPNPAFREVACQTLTRQQLGLPPSGFVYCCFNDSYKISPETFQTWMRILKRVPSSTMMLCVDHPQAAQNLRQQALACGIEPRRLVFCGRAPLPVYMARFEVADLFLDTQPYNAGTTASDALWSATPIITCIGKSFSARIAASVLHSAGMDELVTHTPEEYEDLAVSLANDTARLHKLKKKLIGCRASQLFNPGAYTVHLELALHQMQTRLNAGLPLKDIHIQQYALQNSFSHSPVAAFALPFYTRSVGHQHTLVPLAMHANLDSQILDQVFVRAYEMPMIPLLNGGAVLDQPPNQLLRQTRNHTPCDQLTSNQSAGQSKAHVLEGHFIYGGPLYRHHFGHFMAECIHRIIPSQHQFGDGKWLFVVETDCADRYRLPAYITQAFEFLGIRADAVTLIDQDTIVQSLAICEQGSDLGGGPKEGYLDDLHEYTTPKLNALYGKKDKTSKVYVSRSNVLTGGTFLGESYLESLLQEEGFQIFRPEEHSLTWQMDVYRSAKILIFPEGSACHGVELLGKASLGDCYLIARRDDIARSFFSKILEPRSNKFRVISAQKPVGTIVIEPDTQVAATHREVCLYDTKALLDFFRCESLASLQGFNESQYYQAAAKDLWRYINYHFKQERRSTSLKLVAHLLLNYLRAGLT